MTTGDVRVVSLASHPQHIPALIEAFAAQWPAWCGSAPRSEVERCFACAVPGALPQAFVALERDTPIGTISLRPYFADEPMAQTPWVRGLLVLPRWRGGPAFRMLGDTVEQAARAMGFGYLHAATTSIERLIVRQGWEVFERPERGGERFAFLRKRL